MHENSANFSSVFTGGKKSIANSLNAKITLFIKIVKLALGSFNHLNFNFKTAGFICFKLLPFMNAIVKNFSSGLTLVNESLTLSVAVGLGFSSNKQGATKLKPRNNSWAFALAGIPGESVN